ncbi:hypothetical protein EMIHUDRAFT_259873, partial [Emiliania huxleyi CCMP1516]|uniref:Uncharacterized protein n=2 Tax=Emiliania huxleyi TaxID=2903 RepID=A0A0D3HXB2_EMIH1
AAVCGGADGVQVLRLELVRQAGARERSFICRQHDGTAVGRVRPLHKPHVGRRPRERGVCALRAAAEPQRLLPGAADGRRHLSRLDGGDVHGQRAGEVGRERVVERDVGGGDQRVGALHLPQPAVCGGADGVQVL